MVVTNMPALLSSGNESARTGANGHHHDDDHLENGADSDTDQPEQAKMGLLKQQRRLSSLHASTFRLSGHLTNSVKVTRVTFFVNGDRHFRGIPYVINLDRIKTLDLLCTELSRILVSVKTLPCGVRYILDIASNGAPVESVQDLRLNRLYACSSTVHFVGLDYGQLSHDQTDQSTNGRQAFGAVGNSTLAANRLLGLISSAHIPRPKHASSNGSSLTLSASLSLYSSGVSAVRPKIVALLAGACRAAPPLRPSRRAFRFLLNHRIALTFEQLLNEISNCVHLNIGAVHRVYGLSSNKKIASLDDFLDNEYVYLVYGRTEKCSLADFMLDECEQREIASIVRSSYQFPADLAKIKLGKREAAKPTIRFQLAPKERRHANGNASKRTRDGNNNDKDLKAFSLPRNFLTNSHRNYHQFSTIFSNGDPTVNGSSPGEHQFSGHTNGHESEPCEVPFEDSANSSYVSSLYSLKEGTHPSRGYDLKISNSENHLSAMNPHYRNHVYSTPSNNSLVFDTMAQHYPSLKADDTQTVSSTSVRPPSFSGSSTPGAASSVSCSDDFSYASLEPTGTLDEQPYGSKSVHFTNKSLYRSHDSSSSSDSSTPSFSSLSCEVRYPGGTLPPGADHKGLPSPHSSSNNSTPRHYPQYKPHSAVPHHYGDDSSEPESPLDLEAPPPPVASHLLNGERSMSQFKAKPEVAKLYRLGEAIGDGKFGVVYNATNRITGRVYAIKVVDKRAMQEMMSKSSSKSGVSSPSNSANSEAAILKRICHPNIVRIYDHFEFIDQSYLVLELFKGGDLFDAISVATKYAEREAAEAVNDLVQALAYLHRHNIVHRDIKLENLMVAFVPLTNSTRASLEDGPVPRRYRQMIKLADFGLAVEINPNELLFTVCGTPTYVAPEILLEIGYTFPVDIWAAGVIAYILLCGYPPFANEENDQDALFDQIISCKFDFEGRQWREISDQAKDLITSLLNVEQSARLTAVQVLKHPWLLVPEWP